MRRRLVAIFAAVLVSTVAGAWALPAASAHTDPWAKFCGVAQRIRTTKLSAYAPGKWGNPKLPHLHHDLIVAAPTGTFRAALLVADPRLQSPLGGTPRARVLTALRAVNTQLVRHCDLDTTIFGLIVGKTVTPITTTTSATTTTTTPTEPEASVAPDETAEPAPAPSTDPPAAHSPLTPPIPATVPPPCTYGDTEIRNGVLYTCGPDGYWAQGSTPVS